MSLKPPIRFAAVGLNHDHIFGMTQLLLDAGAELAAVYAEEPELRAGYRGRFPQATEAESMQQILEDESIALIISAAIPADRAAVGVAALQHGKDFMSDKPGFTTRAQLEEARRVQAETGRIWSINYSERFENRATQHAGELVRQGAIGQVVQTVGLGPHRRRFQTRAPWFFERERFGGILNDIASHQIDQFIYFTQAESVEIVASQVANYHHPQFPEFEDFGDVILRGPTCSGYIRVDWFTPDGMSTWGDTRLIVIGTEGTLEIRKNVDVAGRPGANHVFLIDNQQEQYIDCSQIELTYGPRLLHDIEHRTETAMSQAHCFWVAELALQAQESAARLGHLQQPT